MFSMMNNKFVQIDTLFTFKNDLKIRFLGFSLILTNQIN